MMLMLLSGCTAFISEASDFGHLENDATQLLQRSVVKPSLQQVAKRSGPIVVSSCDQMSDATTDWEQQYNKALSAICSEPSLRPLAEVTVDPNFEQQYKNHYGPDGWIDKAWVNYVGVSGPNDTFGKLTRKLALSTRRASDHPLVIVNFGEAALTDVPADKFPNVVLLRAKGLKAGKLHMSFNFNKLRAILLARVKTGVSLDSDMIMIGKQADNLLQRTAEEITKDYPYVMMPTHFLDRDPKDQHHPGWRKEQSNFLAYRCHGCPNATMRWGQAQPSWTYWSLPFLSKWLSAKFLNRVENGVTVRLIREDEDLLNVALWSEGARKSWCAFQPPGTNFIWEHLVGQKLIWDWAPHGFYDDPHYFPDGVPLALYFIHGDKNATRIDEALKYVENKSVLVDAAKPFFQRKFYKSFVELSKDHPNLGCTM